MEKEHEEETRALEETTTAGGTPDDELQSEPQAEIEESYRERDQFRQMLQRVQADFTNYRRRSEEEKEQHQKYANSRLVLRLLPVLDDLDLAIDHASKSGADPSWLDGIKLIQRKLASLVESESVTKIEVEGRPFDPLEHEAMSFQESETHQDGQILTVVRDGYKLHDRVIRPALVILARNLGATDTETRPIVEEESGDAQDNRN